MTNPSPWLEVAQRIARPWMNATATIYRYTETVDSNARLLTSESLIGTCAMWVERSFLSPLDGAGAYEEPRVAQYIGHCPLETDIKRNDVIYIHATRYRVLGVSSGPTHSGEMRVTMDMAAYDGEMMP